MNISLPTKACAFALSLVFPLLSLPLAKPALALESSNVQGSDDTYASAGISANYYNIFTKVSTAAETISDTALTGIDTSADNGYIRGILTGDLTEPAIAEEALMIQADPEVEIISDAEQAYADALYEIVEIEYEVLGAADWFSQAQYVLPRGADAMITDIETGRSFYMRRTYGTNHADVEPLTTEDADIIREVWGGRWSWDRRAVIVTIGSTIMAASLSAMPHAGLDSAPELNYVSGRSGGYGYGQNLDAVKGNGVDGHMDLHFSGSRTHSSNRVNAAHQNMIVEADSYIAMNY